MTEISYRVASRLLKADHRLGMKFDVLVPARLFVDCPDDYSTQFMADLTAALSSSPDFLNVRLAEFANREIVS